MSDLGGKVGDGAGAGDWVKETTTAGFRKDVIAESVRQPVLVDFWAPWCGPCRQLMPVLEKAVRAADGKIKLVKMNIDDHPQIASQLGVQSIPAIIAFQKGQPVDGFMGALPESQVKAFIERLVGSEGGIETSLLEEAERARAAGDEATAESVFHELLAQAPGHPKALAGLASIHIARGELDEARDALAQIEEAGRSDPAAAAAMAALELAQQASSVEDLPELEKRVAADPRDHQSRFDLALALNARGAKAEAASCLLDSFRLDPHWNEDAARKQLLQFFEAWGPMDPETIAARRRLSSMLFS